MDVKLLKDIRETEDKAMEIIQNAEKKKIEFIEAAKLASIRAYEEFLKDAEQRREVMLAEKRAEIKRQKKAINNASEKEVGKIKERALLNVDKAIRFVVERFKKAV